jgi:TetR/AcrR family transcriptional regulator, regulator of cefoperazone and chloramphenicol sensitivity
MVKLPASSTPPRGAQNSAADRTRAALIHAGLKLFGSQGFGATSTREIAALAKANIGSIAYHFGGKDGLHAACADYIVETIQAIAGPALAEAAASSINDAESAKARLSLAIERMVSFLVASPEAGDIAQFVMRELSQPSPALDRIYAGVFEPTHRQLCQIWQQATGEEPDSEATKISVFTMIGQIVYFRIAREAVMRRLGWAAIGPKEATAIADIVKGNLDAILNARKGPKP